MGWVKDSKEILGQLLTIEKDFESVKRRLTLLEKCCETNKLDLVRLSTIAEQLPTAMETSFENKKLQLKLEINEYVDLRVSESIKQLPSK